MFPCLEVNSNSSTLTKYTRAVYPTQSWPHHALAQLMGTTNPGERLLYHCCWGRNWSSHGSRNLCKVTAEPTKGKPMTQVHTDTLQLLHDALPPVTHRWTEALVSAPLGHTKNAGSVTISVPHIPRRWLPVSQAPHKHGRLRPQNWVCWAAQASPWMTVNSQSSWETWLCFPG